MFNIVLRFAHYLCCCWEFEEFDGFGKIIISVH